VKILVTGGGGFAGRHLLRELVAGGARELTATVLGEVAESVADDPELAGITWRSLDLASLNSVRGVVAEVRPEVVYHLAGQASVGESFESPLRTWEVNATGTLRLFAGLERESPETRRVLLISSGEVYGAVKAELQPVREDGPSRPVTPYGLSKAAAELVALQVGRLRGIEVVVARSFNHIGPGQDERFVLASVARQLVRPHDETGTSVIRIGNLEVTRDFLDVRDVARAYARLMEAGRPGATYNVCSGTARSLLEVVERLVEISATGARLEVDRDRVRPADIPHLVGHPGQLQAIGWAPRISLDETLRDLLEEAARRE
jgi:GDP-4-dehydro-6-deoxy-D-mannose reductase